MTDAMQFLDRFRLMIGDKNIGKIVKTRIIIFGVGGVGSAVAQFLVRSGVSYLDIVDFDRIDVTNINRQLVAFQSNIGMMKVDEMKRQLLDINPNLSIETFPFKLDGDTISKINFSNYDIIIDCIDDLKAKKLLIKSAHEHKIYILSCMGAGNRFKDFPKFEIDDIHKTSYDPIAKIIRKFCTQEGINHLDVCYTKQKAMKIDCKTIGSVVYYPISMATVVSTKIINKIIE